MILPGFFLTLEGIEGVGKSTCVRFIAKYLTKNNIPIVVTREPGGTPFAEKIRELLLHRHTEPVDSHTELLLLFAARAQHLSEVILPALQQGSWVICDRFTDATYAYQGGGRGIPMESIAVLEKLVQDHFRPHMTLLLDAPVRKALRRTQRRKQTDRIESEKETFFRKIRRCYLKRAAAETKRIRIIDASKPLSLVKQQLQEVLDPMIVKFLQAHESDSHKK